MIENLTIVNATVEGRYNVGVVAGCPYTSEYKNIHVKGDVKVDGFAYVGGIFGKNLYDNATNLSIIANEGSYVNAYSIENGKEYRTYVGGVVGFMGEGNITVSDVKSNINVTGTTSNAGGITGIAHYNNTFINCHSSGNVTMTKADVDLATEIGGIAGVWHDKTGTTVTIKDCSFTGTLNVEGKNITFQNFGLVGSKYNAGTGTLNLDYILSTPQQLQLLANEVNVNGKTFADKTIKLGADIDLSSIADWQPIGQYYGGNEFKGTFDGDNKTISNMKVVNKNGSTSGSDIYGRGFFGSVRSATIQNVTFDKAVIDFGSYKGNCQGIVTGYARSTDFKNVIVSNSYNKGLGKLGVFVGYEDEITTITFDDKCRIVNSTIDGVYNMAALIGLITENGNGKTQVTMPDNIDISDVTINNDTTGRNFVSMFGGYYWASSNNIDHYLVSSPYYCTHRVSFTENMPDNYIAIDGYAYGVELIDTGDFYEYTNSLGTNTYPLVRYFPN